ncbi:hypothetical protein ABIA24_005321 [Sinorhizobium fredii]
MLATNFGLPPGRDFAPIQLASPRSSEANGHMMLFTDFGLSAVNQGRADSELGLAVGSTVEISS